MSRPSSSPGSSCSSASGPGRAGVLRWSLPGIGARLGRAELGEDVGDRLADRLRVDAVLGVVRLLELAPAVASREIARCIESVTLSAYMITWPSTLRAARPIVWISDVSRAQEALLVGVEDRHQRHLGQVEALPQQVDADQHVELAEAEVAEDLDALDGVDLGWR